MLRRKQMVSTALLLLSLSCTTCEDPWTHQRSYWTPAQVCPTTRTIVVHSAEDGLVSAPSIATSTKGGHLVVAWVSGGELNWAMLSAQGELLRKVRATHGVIDHDLKYIDGRFTLAWTRRALFAHTVELLEIDSVTGAADEAEVLYRSPVPVSEVTLSAWQGSWAVGWSGEGCPGHRSCLRIMTPDGPLRLPKMTRRGAMARAPQLLKTADAGLLLWLERGANNVVTLKTLDREGRDSDTARTVPLKVGGRVGAPSAVVTPAGAIMTFANRLVGGDLQVWIATLDAGGELEARVFAGGEEPTAPPLIVLGSDGPEVLWISALGIARRRAQSPGALTQAVPFSQGTPHAFSSAPVPAGGLWVVAAIGGKILLKTQGTSCAEAAASNSAEDRLRP